MKIILEKTKGEYICRIEKINKEYKISLLKNNIEIREITFTELENAIHLYNETFTCK